ncbi:MAG: glycosyltransferase family 4 protein [Opitutae bacterium]|nr:glycosyltransferase family 4 protein [Opitutae bacterium]
MSEAAGWQFDIEVHPPSWHFPVGASWLAGWIGVSGDHYATDLRVWIDRRPFLGLPGLPKPGMDERFLGRAGPPFTGFVAQVTPHRNAKLLRVEVRNPAGEWREIFRTAITVAPDAPAALTPPPLADRFPELLLDLLRQRRRVPGKSWTALADEIAAGALATPLDTLPNPPFHGALEEPRATGRTTDHRLIVTGWLAHRAGKIRRLTAIVDGRNTSPLIHGLARGDVGTVFAGLSEGERVQFVGQVDVVPEPGVPALLKIFAELESGEKHLVFAQRFLPHVASGPELLLPPLSLGVFVRAWWSLRAAAARLGSGAGPLAREIASLRRAWARFREEAPTSRRHYPLPAPHPLSRRAAPLRILAATHNLNFEGAPRLLFELLAYHRREAGAVVHVLSPAEGPMRALFETAGMTVQVVDLEPALRASDDTEFQSALQSAVPLDWSGVDLVVANTLVSFWAVHLAAAAHKPSLLYVHESAPLRRFFATRPLQLAAERAFSLATQVAFTAAASRHIFTQLDPQARFRVLPTWLNLAAIDAFAAQHAPTTLRAQHGVNPAALVVLNLGAVCARKGQHVFVRCAELLGAEWRAQHPDRPLEFVMVGARDDAYQTALQQQVDEAGLDCVRFVPETRENFDWLRLADVLVCTSFEESSPRVLLEAAAFRTPIVTTDVNGIPELVTADEAWLVPPGDARQLAAALRAALAALSAGDHTRTERARLVVEKRFDERVALPQHLALANATADR